MSLPKVTGLRGLRWIADVVGYLSSKIHKPCLTEAIGDQEGKGLDPLIEELDGLMTQRADSRVAEELASVFALKRDIKYARRSRRWLYVRGYVGKSDMGYENWVAFVKENRLGNPDVARYAKTNPALLGNISIQDAMGLNTEAVQTLGNDPTRYERSVQGTSGIRG